MPVHTRRDGPVSWVVIDREGKGNSLDYEHARLLAEAVRGECGAPGTSVVAIRGAGDRFFSTGVDLESVASIGGPGDSWRLMYEGLGGVCRAVAECPKPVVAAVNGHAIGIGFELLHAADIAVAVRWAKLGTPAVRWGMVPPATPTVAPWLIGYKRAAYLVLTGDTITAEEAARQGIVNFVVDSVEELEAKVVEVAERIAANDPWAVRMARELLREARPHAMLQRGLLALVYSAARPETVERARGFVESRRRRGAGGG
ncbi:MAG: enoyl-CoA hydratase/isomerase family protein [Desulfurococcales archaeon]|nr:enoyl-CoA hydratase/isomerase family protein [Desulfurococcales archaeon]